MNQDIISKVKEIRNLFLADGFVIKGVFGSYSRDEANSQSDIDILYDLNGSFREKYRGFKAVAKLDDIQKTISFLLGIEADLVQKQYLGTISAKYILPEVNYVE